MHCRIGTKNAILRVLAVKAATFGDVLGRFACRLGTKNAILRVLAIEAALGFKGKIVYLSVWTENGKYGLTF